MRKCWTFPDEAINDQGNQDQILTIFIDGLRDVRIRRHIIRKRPKNASKALTHAIEEQELLNEIDTRVHVEKPNHNNKNQGYGYIDEARYKPTPKRQKQPIGVKCLISTQIQPRVNIAHT